MKIVIKESDEMIRFEDLDFLYHYIVGKFSLGDDIFIVDERGTMINPVTGTEEGLFTEEIVIDCEELQAFNTEEEARVYLKSIL